MKPLGNKTLPFSTKYPLVKEAHFLLQQVFCGRERKKAVCQGSTLPIRGENCRKSRKKNSGLWFVKVAHFLLGRTGAKIVEPRPGKGNGKGRRLVQKSNVKREGSRCNQAPGSTLVRKEIHGVTRAFALARIVPGKLPGSSVHLVCWRVPHRPGVPVLGIAAPQGRETPAGAGRRMVKQRCLQDGLQGSFARR